MEPSLGRADVLARPPVPQSDVSARLVALFAALVFVSGACALMYQVLWVRQLGLVFGVTTHAASTVLAAFMGGLAAGSVLAGWLADRVRHPLLWFAGVEAGIGLTALATQPAFEELQQIYRVVYPLAPEGWTLTIVRFLTASLLLLGPTMLMGATLPLIVRALVARIDAIGRRVAVLYSLNTAGAIAGTLGAAYVFIPTTGLSASFRIAAAANLAVAVATLAVWLAGRRSDDGALPVRARPSAAGDPIPIAPRVRRTILFVFAVSGFVAIGLEVVWFRVLLVFQAATTYAFAVMLATVLGGIAAGSALAPFAMRRTKDLLRHLVALEFAIPITAVFSLAVLCLTYQAGWRTGALVQASVLAIFPASVVMGWAFPVGVHLWTAGARDASRRMARRLGRLYAVNVLGGIGGSVVAGFVLLPAIGTRGSLLLLALLGLAAATWLALVSLPAQAAWRRVVVAGGLVAVGAWLLPDPAAAVLARRHPGETRLWSEQGVQGAVAVHAQLDGTRVLYLDGLHQANDSEPMVYVHRRIGALAAALHPDPRRALVVGLGGGVTPGGLAMRPGLSVDIVELAAPVVEAASWFSHVNLDVLSRPSVRMLVNDGRNHLLLSGARYDVITADIIQPFHAGAGNVYSAEYFRLAREALTGDGLMVQWVGQRAATQYRLIARTFQSVFPHATAWAGGTLLVGSRGPLEVHRADVERMLGDERWRGVLASVGIGSVEALAALYTAGPDALRAFVGPGPVLTDDRPLIEFFRSLPRSESDIDLTPLRGNAREVLRDLED